MLASHICKYATLMAAAELIIYDVQAISAVKKKQIKIMKSTVGFVSAAHHRITVHFFSLVMFLDTRTVSDN